MSQWGPTTAGPHLPDLSGAHPRGTTPGTYTQEELP